MTIADEWLRIASMVRWGYDPSWQCNRCGCTGFVTTRDDEHTWPAKDGNYYGRLCKACVTEIESKHNDTSRVEGGG